MATEKSIVVHPGDIIQGIGQDNRNGLLFLVTETHRWGVGAVLRWVQGTEEFEVYQRFKPGQFSVVGTAAILPPLVLQRRKDSLASAAAVEAERARADDQKIVMVLMDGPPAFTGWLLKSFDFEADDGRGEIEMTPVLAEAMRFDSLKDAMAFRQRQPECRPTRDDGQPNRPLSATTWQFSTIAALRELGQ